MAAEQTFYCGHLLPIMPSEDLCSPCIDPECDLEHDRSLLNVECDSDNVAKLGACGIQVCLRVEIWLIHLRGEKGVGIDNLELR